MYKYALKYEIVEKDYSAFLYIPKPENDESGEPFTEEDLSVLWKHQQHPVVEMLLIMCYSGLRIKSYTDIEVDLKSGCFKSGVKTETSKGCTVPIHSAIHPLVSRRYNGSKNLLLSSTSYFRTRMYNTLEDMGIEKHTPHGCRHTFSMLCEKYKVNENDRKRMLGHSFGNDITNAIYGHRSLDDLRKEIEKIKAP